MKLTRRGKRVRALFILAGICLVIGAGIYRLSHSPIYGDCRESLDGTVCTLIGYKANN